MTVHSISKKRMDKLLKLFDDFAKGKDDAFDDQPIEEGVKSLEEQQKINAEKARKRREMRAQDNESVKRQYQLKKD